MSRRPNYAVPRTPLLEAPRPSVSLPTPRAFVAGNLKCWLKADAISGLADNDPVATWTDSSGNGNVAAQGTGVSQPLYQTGELNGLPVVRFDGSNDFMVVAGITNNQAARTLFVVSDAITLTAGAGLFGLTSASNVQMTAAGVYRYINKQATNPQTFGAAADAFPHLTTIRWNSTSSVDAAQDGESFTNFDPDDGYQTATGAQLTFGARTQAGGSPSNIDIGEALVFDAALSDTELETVRTYLITKWFGVSMVTKVLKYRSGGSFATKPLKYRSGGGFTTKPLKWGS
jgi:hypothetical protein